MENQNMFSKESIIVIIILTILVIGLAGYVGYDKFLNTNNDVTEENSKNECDNKDVDEKTEEDKNEYIKTRKCIGVYSGEAALSGNISNSKYNMGTLTIELKADGTYNLMKEKIYDVPVTSEYIIIDNALLLKTVQHICGP